MSAINALYTIRSGQRTRKSVQFFEFIAGEFAKSEVALDLLEAKIRKALSDPSIISGDILDVAVPASRIANRVMKTVSRMPAVKTDLTLATCVSELDLILNMADNGEFETESRKLHLNTARNIVTRVSANLVSAKNELIQTHL